jgi:hypothetical protein
MGAAATFWDYVHRAGAFPTACALCGSDLPQWASLCRGRGVVANRKMPTPVRAPHGGDGADRR